MRGCCASAPIDHPEKGDEVAGDIGQAGSAHDVWKDRICLLSDICLRVMIEPATEQPITLQVHADYAGNDASPLDLQQETFPPISQPSGIGH
jgi:hypothetical protein